MRKLTFQCSIASGLTPFIDIQQQSVALHQNGNTWSGSRAVNVEDKLDIAVTVSGINGSPWTVDITIDCPGGSAAKIFSRKGTIPQGGSQRFTASANVPAQPCGAQKEMAVKAKTRPKKKITKTKKKKQTKPSRRARRP